MGCTTDRHSAVVDEVIVHDDFSISVDLTPENAPAPFLLDPMRLDACGHGFFTLFPELRAIERGVTYIPVRIEEVTLVHPGVSPTRALIEITSKSERSIVANSHIFGADNEIVAVIRGIRTQAMSPKRTNAIEAMAFIEMPQPIDGTILAETGTNATAREIVEDAGALDIAVADPKSSTDLEMLIEGWATVTGYEIASALAIQGKIDIDALVATGRIPEALSKWVASILFQTREHGSCDAR